ncbi:hypothetical protein DM860_012263 [Cuscuta australis]|uniref:Uncharacterized protein n=1 Tax=Cuscuta australis TaxID=267555 RepID=A0A328EAF9_9ASTE|nr:hypothetical protein DM860_012263 [Cuscuta australis]
MLSPCTPSLSDSSPQSCHAAHLHVSSSKHDFKMRWSRAEDDNGGDLSDSGRYVAATMTVVGIIVDDDCGSGRHCQ